MSEDKIDNWRIVPQFDFADYDPPLISIIPSDGFHLPIMKEGDFLSLLFKESTPRETAKKIWKLLHDHVEFVQFTGEKRPGFPPGLRKRPEKTSKLR